MNYTRARGHTQHPTHSFTHTCSPHSHTQIKTLSSHTHTQIHSLTSLIQTCITSSRSLPPYLYRHYILTSLPPPSYHSSCTPPCHLLAHPHTTSKSHLVLHQPRAWPHPITPSPTARCHTLEGKLWSMWPLNSTRAPAKDSVTYIKSYLWSFNGC